MFKLEHVLLLKEDERIKAITKRHGVALIPGLALALVLLVAPFFFLFPLFRTGPPGVVVFAILVLVGVFIAIRTFVMWDGDVFIVTDLRIVDVDQRGLFSRTVSEVKLEDIQDVSWSKNGLMDMFLKVGTLKVQTYSGALAVEAQFIPRPQEIHNLLNDLRQTVKSQTPEAPTFSVKGGSVFDGKSGVSPQRNDVLKRVASKLEALGDEELVKLDRTLKQEDRDLTIRKLFGEGKSEELKPLDDKP